ncbi:MAG TPA: hypothetical protein VF234_02180, partial [Limnochordia bacterium]
GHAVLESDRWRLTFIRTPHGFAAAVLYGWESGEARWVPLATLPAARLAVRTEAGVEEAALIPAAVTPIAADGADGPGLALSGSVAVGSRRWTFSATYRLRGRPAGIDAVYEIRPDGPAELVRLLGPTLLVGERSFGGEKAAALFPGLEWLTGGERSSSALDARPPLDRREAPHPLKVTVPFMAVLSQGFVVALMWDPLQHWAGEQALPTARFVSPNWIDGQANHWLSLSVPSIGEWVPENATLATTPYPVEAGETVRLAAHIAVKPSNDILDAWELYVARYGIPAPSPLPRSWEAERALLADAYMRSYWIPAAQGWGHVHGWEPQPFPGLAEVLRLLADRESDPERRRAMDARIEEVMRAAVLRHDPGWLGTSAGGHIPLRTFPFYVGFVEQALRRWAEEVEGLRRTQTPEGHWLFQPTSEAQAALGERGAKALGLTATPAWSVLYYARVTGDPAARAAGLRALAAMREFRVPRAAQTWEVPVHAPDILAAAKAVGAYVEGYRITGDPAYLDDARYWARAGLPFVYLWAMPDRPTMLFATIPVFGATHYVLPWFGRAVQWNGLVYAYHLMELAEFDRSLPWATIARGIVTAAMHWQRTEDPARGGYTDVWEIIPNRPILNVDINPEGIAKAAFYVFEQQSPGIQTALLQGGDRTVRINAVTPIEGARLTADRLAFELPYVDGRTSHVLIVGAPRPRTVRVRGAPIPAESFYALHEQAWTYTPEGYLVIKVRHAGRTPVEVGF